MKELNLIKKAPRWLVWYLSYNFEGKTERQKRRQFAINFTCLIGGTISPLFGLYYLTHDLSLWYATIVAVALGLGAYALPLVSRFGDTPFVFATTVLLCGSCIALTLLLGARSGIFMYILIITTMMIIYVGSERVALLLFSTLVSIASITLCFFLPSDGWLTAANTPPLHTVLLISSVPVPILMIAGVMFASFRRMERAEDALEAEYTRSEALLYNLLPEDIAARLKIEPYRTIADSLPQVAILFADVVDFTPRAASLPPEEIVGFLNRIFRSFDQLAAKHGLEKIKTIGDAYMVAAGMPNPVGDPVHRVAEMALDMQRTAEKMASDLPGGLQVRIGLHAGPAVAGVIGNRKLFYDVWGETVNTASRMESHGEPGRIQVTASAKKELEEDYDFQLRGMVKVKGMGDVETWWLTGRRAETRIRKND